MGWTVKEDGKGMYKKNNDGITNAYKSIGYSDYKGNWSHLMPVVHKIFTVNFNEYPSVESLSCEQRGIFDPLHYGLHSTTQHVYKGVIDFIIFYNTQQPVNNITPM